ncbi:MAG: mucoidy inhibitor MuiA family protein [Erysipelotrichaceae bacterium]|nr:mucoidy inhibitor MuiA family protein [Erysipelotrichaceae bacterium]
MTESIIREAAIYRNGAIIRRTGNIHLEAGKQSVQIYGLTRDADTNTVRLALPEGLAGNNVQVMVLTKEAQQEMTNELWKKLNQTETRIATLNRQIELWEINADFSSKESLSIKEMSDYIEMIPERKEKLQKEIEKLEEEKKELNRQLSEKQKEAERYIVTADITAEKEGDYPFELRYYAGRLSWQPVYEIHTDDDNDRIMIRLRGKIQQNTSEDWKNVKVTLYTGNPSLSGTIPHLSPEYLNFYVHSVRRNYAMGAMAAKASMAMEDAMVEYEVEEEAPAAFAMADVVNAQAQRRDNNVMMEYELPGSWNIDKETEVYSDISDQYVDCRYHVISIPKIDDNAYLAAEVDTAALEDLQQTEAAVYNKGTFMGNVYLDADMTEEKYDLSLGIDETIKVVRKQARKHSSTVLLKGQKKTEYEYEIKVTSRKNKTCQMTVIDQIPVSQDKTIVVDQKNISSGVFKEETGEVKWDFDLEPQQTKTLNLAYDVAWPKDKKINI